MHGWFAIQKKMTHRYFFTFLAIQEQHVVLSGKRPFYCWRTWGFRRRGRVRVGGFLWGWGERTTMKHPSTLWGKRSSNYFCTHFCVLHGKNISGCLGLSCFLHGSQWISMNLFQKKMIQWLHIRINNFDHFRYFLVKVHHEWHGLKVQPSFIAFSTTLLACSRSSQWKAWKHIGDIPKNIFKKRGQFDLSSFWDVLRQLRICFLLSRQ